MPNSPFPLESATTARLGSAFANCAQVGLQHTSLDEALHDLKSSTPYTRTHLQVVLQPLTRPLQPEVTYSIQFRDKYTRIHPTT